MLKNSCKLPIIDSMTVQNEIRLKVRLLWEYDECTNRNAGAFRRFEKALETSEVKEVVIDMGKCKYLSISGLRSILEWSSSMSERGIVVKIDNLDPMLKNVFILARLDWILVKAA